MFERYTEKARRVIFFGRHQASQFGSSYIETEHLLLGLLHEDKSIAHQFLDDYASIESIRKQITGHTVIREKVPTSVDLPLSNQCKRALGYAAEEAELLSLNFIGPEHLLLGLLREQNCFAARLLNERSVFLGMARERLGSNSSERLGLAPKSPGLPAGYTFHKLLYNTRAEMVILELRPAARPLPTRLFARHKDVEAYEQIGSPAEDISYKSPVTCERQPLVVFNSLKWDKTRRMGDWEESTPSISPRRN